MRFESRFYCRGEAEVVNPARDSHFYNKIIPCIGNFIVENLQSQASEGLVGLINAFSGGAFANASILALGIMPYISASIVIQLAGLAVPAVQKMQKVFSTQENGYTLSSGKLLLIFI